MNFGEGKTLGERPLSSGKRGLTPNPTLYQSRSHHAPSKMNADLKTVLWTEHDGNFFLRMGLDIVY